MNTKIKYIFFTIAVIAFVIAVIVYYRKQVTGIRNTEARLSIYKNVKQSVFDNDPSAIQTGFVNAVKDENNNEIVKTYAYWLTHRYADNGGNAREMYDFVNSHPELDFLKEAESLEPENFKKLVDGDIKNLTDEANSINLAYMLVLDKYNYLDIAGIANISSGYAKLAYNQKSIQGENKHEKYLAISEQYFTKAKDIIDNQIFNPDVINKNITDLDIVVGLNHYLFAHGLLYMNTGTLINIDRHAIYKYAINLAREKAPSHKEFTVYLYLVSSMMIEPQSFRDYDVVSEDDLYLIALLKKDTPMSIKILQSKTEELASPYNRNYIKKIAGLSLLLKQWLIVNSDGNWTEKDFK